MKYKFILGFEYTKYKNPAKIIISTEDRLIDEFSLEQDISGSTNIVENLDKTFFHKHIGPKRCNHKPSPACLKRLYKGYPLLSPHQGPQDPAVFERTWSIDSVPKFIKVYDIDSSSIDRQIKVKVVNPNSNYNNGFITKSSMIKFSLVALFPAKLTKNKCEALMNMILRLESVHHYPEAPPIIQQTWPRLESFDVNAEGDDRKLIKHSDEWIGGNFTIDLKIRQKYGIKYLSADSMSTYGIWDIGRAPLTYVVGSHKQLLNIYNEDQRSNNT